MTPPRRRQAPPLETPAAHARRLLLGIGLVVVIYAAAALGLRPPAPLAEDGAPLRFSAGRAAAVLDELAEGLGSRPTGSAAALAVRERIQERLTRLGLAPTVQDVFACGPTPMFAALADLLAALEALPEDADGEAVQIQVYEVGKRHDFAELRAWFKALYEILLGQEPTDARIAEAAAAAAAEDIVPKAEDRHEEREDTDFDDGPEISFADLHAYLSGRFLHVKPRT